MSTTAASQKKRKPKNVLGVCWAVKRIIGDEQAKHGRCLLNAVELSARSGYPRVSVHGALYELRKRAEIEQAGTHPYDRRVPAWRLANSDLQVDSPSDRYHETAASGVLATLRPPVDRAVYIEYLQNCGDDGMVCLRAGEVADQLEYSHHEVRLARIRLVDRGLLVPAGRCPANGNLRRYQLPRLDELGPDTGTVASHPLLPGHAGELATHVATLAEARRLLDNEEGLTTRIEKARSERARGVLAGVKRRVHWELVKWTDPWSQVRLSVEQLSKMTGTNARSVVNALRGLEEAGLLEILVSTPAGRIMRVWPAIYVKQKPSRQRAPHPAVKTLAKQGVLRRLPLQQRWALMAYLNHADAKRRAFLSRAEIADETGMSETTASAARSSLVKRGILKPVRGQERREVMAKAGCSEAFISKNSKLTAYRVMLAGFRLSERTAWPPEERPLYWRQQHRNAGGTNRQPQARGSTADQGGSLLPDGTRLDDERLRVVLPDGTTHGLTPDQYRVVSCIARALGAWLTSDELKIEAAPNQRIDRVIRGQKNRDGGRWGGLPKAIQDRIKASTNKGYQWAYEQT